MRSTVSTFVSELRTNLQGRPNLANVPVDLVPTGDTSQRERITLVVGRIEGGQERYAMGVVQDEYRIPGQLDAFAADPDTDSAFRQAFVRAGLLLDEIAVELDTNPPDVGTKVLDALLTTIGYTPLVVDNGGWVCRCDFIIDYQATVK